MKAAFSGTAFKRAFRAGDRAAETYGGATHYTGPPRLNAYARAIEANRYTRAQKARAKTSKNLLKVSASVWREV